MTDPKDVLSNHLEARHDGLLGPRKEMKPGDYVLATKYHDGDPCDHFFVGFLIQETHDGRYLVGDSKGICQRANGFRRCEEITQEEGDKLLAIFPDISDKPGLSLWAHLEIIRKQTDDFKVNQAKCRGCSTQILIPLGKSVKEMMQEDYLCAACSEAEDLRKRLAIFMVSNDSMVGILTGRYRITNLPKDSRIIAVIASLDYDGFLIKVQSKEFVRHKENEKLGMINTEFELTKDLLKENENLEEKFQDLMMNGDD